MDDLLIPNYGAYLVPDGVTYIIVALCVVLLLSMVLLDVMVSKASH
ncbi:MAG: hypothetical protein MJA27_11395 [Pseudanabaenales cyanobacterium]|nr:hypothetical protein [Pseudanabaenales cyanobacterium]